MYIQCILHLYCISVWDGRCFERGVNKSVLGQRKFIYTEELCEQMGSSNKVFDTCKCHSVKYESVRKHNKTFRGNCFYIPLVNMLNAFDNMVCETMAIKDYQEEHAQCDWPCEETDYDIQTSDTTWPVQSMVPNFIKKYVKSLPCNVSIRWYYEQLERNYRSPEDQLSDKNLCPESDMSNLGQGIFTLDEYREAFLDLVEGKNLSIDVYENGTLRPNIDQSLTRLRTLEEAQIDWVDKYFYRLNIYFRKRSTEHHIQVISMKWTDFLSACGGVLGLWAGFSAITAAEIFILCAKLCTSCNIRLVSGNNKVCVVSSNLK